MKINNEGKLQVVHDDNLLKLLENLQLSGKLNRGELKCKFCQTIISFDNLAAVFPESDTIKIVCNSPECVLELSNYLNEKNV